MSPADFAALLASCADAATASARRAADLELTAYARERIDAHDFDFAEIDFDADATGGPGRAQRHFSWTPPEVLPSPFFGRGTIVARVPEPRPSGGIPLPRVAPTTRRRMLEGYGLPRAGGVFWYPLRPFDEFATGPDLVLPAGEFRVELQADAWSMSQAAPGSVTVLAFKDGALVATWTQNRLPPTWVIASNEELTTLPARFTPAVANVTVTSGAPMTIALQPGVTSDRIFGMLRAIPVT